MPAGDNAPVTNANGDIASPNTATHDNIADNDEQSDEYFSTVESSNYDSDTLTITSTGDSSFTSFSSSVSRTGSTSTASSDDTFYTANSSTGTTFTTCPEIQTPPVSLLSFCNEFDVLHMH